jgi:hypothetical protein
VSHQSRSIRHWFVGQAVVLHLLTKRRLDLVAGRTQTRRLAPSVRAQVEDHGLDPDGALP